MNVELSEQLSFQPITPEDRHWAEPILFSAGLRCCDSTFTVLYTWKDAYGVRLAHVADFVLCEMDCRYGKVYLYPIGTGDVRPVIDMLRDYAAQNAREFHLVCVTPPEKELLEREYPNRFRFEAYRDAFDYVYNVEKLAELKGKHLHSKRNHIHRFEEEHPVWSVSEVNEDNVGLCMQIEREWKRVVATEVEIEADGTVNQRYEEVAIGLALTHRKALGLDGIILFVEERPVAFALGKQVSSESYDVHFEKADAQMNGCYAMINREFARWIRDHYPTVRYINREDDMGVPGLRFSKESYRPDYMIEKYSALWVD